MVSNRKLKKALTKADVIFWDFDGVIKDSVSVKTEAYMALFPSDELSKRVNVHHDANGGMSRFEKIPLYLKWAGKNITIELVDEYCEKFSQLVFAKVINSPWVPGVRSYLSNNYIEQEFILVTATPQNEIESILKELNIEHYFSECHGAPCKKEDVLFAVLQRLKILPKKSLMIGDSLTDYNAAIKNHVPFILRRTSINSELQAKHSGLSFQSLG